MSRIAIIPARGGSKRIPGKNIRSFCGQPMLSHILRTAQGSGLFDCVHVSTDSPEIATIAAEFGAAPDFMRVSTLADDHTPLLPVLRFVLETYEARGRVFDDVWLLMACAPLIDEEDLKEAERLFVMHGRSRRVWAVAPYPAPVEWAFELEEDRKISMLTPSAYGRRSQDLLPRYYHTGTHIVYPAEYVRNSRGAGHPDGSVGHVISRAKAIDIDTEEDWELAEMFYRQAKGARF